MVRMKRTCLLAVALALLSGLSEARPEKPRKNLRYARSWDDAVEEAKALNVPIVVHRHGFY